MTDYFYDMDLVVDPLNPSNVVANGLVSIYDPADTAGVTLLALKDPSGLPLPNPVHSNANGFLPPRIASLPQVMWKSGGFTGYFNSYKGLRDESVAAKTAAQSAADNAVAAASQVVTTAAVDGTGALVLTKASGATVNAGNVKGAKGDKGDTGAKGADGSNVLPTDDAIKQAINDTASVTRGALNATYAPVAGAAVDLTDGGQAMAATARRINHEINVEKYRLNSDNDTQAVQRAINMAVAGGAAKKRIILPVDYVHTGSIDLNGLSGAIIEGPGPDAQSHKSSIGMQSLFKTTGATQDLIFRGLNFQGTGVDDVTGPRRSRTWGTTGYGTAINLYGDMAPQTRLNAAASAGATTIQTTTALGNGTWWIDGEAVTFLSTTGSAAPYTVTLAAPLAAAHASGAFVTMPYVVKNVRVEHSRIQNLIWASTPGGAPSLPVLFGGLRGYTEFYDMRVENCYDPGFVFNEDVRVNKLSSKNSADNALSVSRGNQRAIITDVDAVNPCYWGVWVAGFNSDSGPNNFLVNNVNVKRPGYGGVTADAASKHGKISDVFVDSMYQRGPTDAPTDSWGCAVYVGGLPSGSLTPTDLATDIVVTDIHSYRAPRAGIILQAVNDVLVTDVKVRDVGTQYLADGTTAISSTDANNNVAVLMLNSTTSTDVTVRGVDARDMRATPYMNYTIRPQSSPTQRFSIYDNYTYGGRNGWDLVDYTYASPSIKTIANGMSWSVNTKHTDGATAGSNTGGGATRGFDVNGAAGVTRPLRWLTAGVERWRLSAGTAAESGGNAGSNLFLDAYDDAGALIQNLATFTRSTGDILLGVVGKALTIRARLISGAGSAAIAALAQAASASAASNGANDTAGTVNVTSQAAPAAGDLCTITFATAYPATPHVILSPANAATAACRPYIKTRSATSVTVACEVAPAASTSLQFDYHVIG